MVEAAKKERTKRKRAVVTNRKLWVEGRRWRWNEKRMCWKERNEKAGGGGGAERGRRSEIEKRET